MIYFIWYYRWQLPQPPSMLCVVPVMYELPSQSKKQISSATSEAFPSLPMGIVEGPFSFGAVSLDF